MDDLDHSRQVKLSIVIPCYNEESTLYNCVTNVLKIADDNLSLEIIIVDDHSDDQSYLIASDLLKIHQGITVFRHEKNQGKGAALRTGIAHASGDYIAVQDADLEYDPQDLKRLLTPLVSGEADVVLGSRFRSSEAGRVLYFWHYMGNRVLTLISNMFTDLNLTDMETCYKVFRRDVIQSIDLKEDRFGFEPEVIAKVAQRRVRIFEIGISYRGRTYEEGKKIRAKDGLRALYCILRYNAHRSPLPLQLLTYLFIGGACAIVNFAAFLLFLKMKISVTISAPLAFILAAAVDYLLCISILFRHRARWNSIIEIFFYIIVVGAVCLFDLLITKVFLAGGFSPAFSKIIASGVIFIFNFIGRRFLIFPEPSLEPWKPQVK